MTRTTVGRSCGNLPRPIAVLGGGRGTDAFEEGLVVVRHRDCADDGVEGGHHRLELPDIAGLQVAVADHHPHQSGL